MPLMEGRVPKPAELSLPSTVSKFESFLANTGAICLLTGSTGIGKSTLVMSICKDEKIDVIEYMGDEISHFEEFCLECSKNIGTLELQGSMTSMKKKEKKKKKSTTSAFSFSSTPSSLSSSSSSKTKQRKQIYLVHQLPWPSPSDPSNSRTHEALQTFNKGRGKMVVVHSEEGEGNMGPKDIEKLIGGVPCQVIQCGKVGVRAMRRIVGGGVPKKEVNGIVEAADGDVRRAMILAKNGGGRRDEKLSHFHALGKLLYCKRGEDGTLNDKPEVVVERSDMGQEGLQAFLQMHCVEFFDDVDELAKAMECFSDSEYFEGKLYTTPSDNIFPKSYSASFMARAVSANLKKKTDHKFRAFNKPKCWDAGKKVRDERQAWGGVGGFERYVTEEREMKIRGEEGGKGGRKGTELKEVVDDEIASDSDDDDF